MLTRISLLSILVISNFILSAQDSLETIPNKYLDKVADKATKITLQVDRKTEQALTRMEKLETKMKARLQRIDSLKAKQIFEGFNEKYRAFKEKIKTAFRDNRYIPSLDTLGNSLRFLQHYPAIMAVRQSQQKLQQALEKVNGLKEAFGKAEEIKTFLRERKQYLNEQLGRWGLARQMRQINKQIYYFSEQLKEYRSILADHKKVERKVIGLLSESALFKDFMKKNSLLAGLFPQPGDLNDPLAQANLAGLQTRVRVNDLIQRQLSTGGPGAQKQFSQNIQDAEVKIRELQARLAGNKGGNNNDIMPDGFKPNNEKTRSFLKRLEYGTTMQNQRANNFFPITTDIALSVGYKLNDRSVIGIGASYKLGWGRGWKQIKLTNEGVGLRSYIDWKVKGNFYLTGGYEQNYRTTFNRIAQLRDIDQWQQSGLVGVSKIVVIRSKLFKKTRLQLLWDFLSYTQMPATPPVLFRVGYNF